MKRKYVAMMLVIIASISIGGSGMAYNLTCTGITDAQDNKITDLVDNWNLVGAGITVSKDDLRILYNGTFYTWDDAVNNTFVLPFIYGWDRQLQNYELVEGFNKGDGYWMYSYVNCTMYFV